MGWFSRKDPDGSDASEQVIDSGRYRPSREVQLGADDRPAAVPIGETEREHLARRLAELREGGIDVDDLDSIGRGYDAAYAAYRAGQLSESHDAAVDRFAVAIGEHLARTTDLRWQIVADVFGTDLGLMGSRGDDVVVPLNLVGARWMRQETGWIPGVVGHLKRTRER